MVHAVVFATTILALSAAALAEVDFTPKESFYLAEATRVPCVAFHNGKEEISYSPPGGWKVSGEGRKVTLTPPDKGQAEATMRTTPAIVPLPATEQNIKAYSEMAARDLPRDATKVKVVDATICPLRISKRDMVEVTLSYALFGQQFTTNIVFLPYEKEQISFQMTARSADFAPLAKAFRASLYSLQGL